METTYQGLSGRTYSISKEIGHGGEGRIYEIAGTSHLVAKVFKDERITKEREEKLTQMVKVKLKQEELEQVMWPQDVIYNQNGFVGYIMPKLTHTDTLISVYSSSGKTYDLRHRIMVAINLCHAIKTVHDMGQVCGDLNPQNICVNLDMEDREHGLQVTLVDADSYHFSTEGRTFRCEVGLTDYIAPEVQKKMTDGMTLKTAPLPTYTKETDLFALAVHIFTLLMNGCHPFACAKQLGGNKIEHTMKQMSGNNVQNSVVAPQPIENIKNGFFPFYEKKEGITYPIYAPGFETLPSGLQALFVRTFVDGYQNPKQRVDTDEWIAVLMALIRENKISQCKKNEKHFYFNHKTECSLCKVEERIAGIFGGGEVPPKPSSKSGNGFGTRMILPPQKPKRKKSEKRFFVLVAVLVALILCGTIIYNTYLNPWEIGEYETVANMGGQMQIPLIAYKGTDESGLVQEIYLAEGKLDTVNIYAGAALIYENDEVGGLVLAQSSYTEAPSDEYLQFIEDYHESVGNDIAYCEAIHLGNLWFTKVVYEEGDDYSKYKIVYSTSNTAISYNATMEVHHPEKLNDYISLMEKMLGSLQLNTTSITGSLYPDDNKFESYYTTDDEVIMYLGRYSTPSQSNYDYKIVTNAGNYSNIKLAPGTYNVMVEGSRYDGNFIYYGTVEIPDSGNSQINLDIRVTWSE